jgi:heme o synthase
MNKPTNQPLNTPLNTSTQNPATKTAPARLPFLWRDYYELCKPRVVLLMLLTVVIGMFMATPGMVEWPVLVFGNIGIALCAASAAAVNHLVDRRIDLEMARTHDRPIAQGRIDTTHAIIFALSMGVAGMVMLLTLVNQLTAWLTLASHVGYAVIYTLWLKRATPQNIVIGGLAGATPPLLGWTAVTNQVDGHALLLVLIIFAWTPPHFWALAIARRDDYAKVNIPMLPVTHGIKYTKLHTLLYTLILFAVTLMPFATHLSGPLYLAGAVLLGAGFIYWAIVMIIDKNPKAPMETFKYSIVYLMALFLIMLLDHYLFPVTAPFV